MRNTSYNACDENELLKDKFEKTKNYFLKHPRSASAVNELVYDYFWKGLFVDQFRDLFFTEDTDVTRAALGMLSEIGARPLLASEAVHLLDQYDDSTIKTRLINYLIDASSLAGHEVVKVLEHLKSENDYIGNITLEFLRKIDIGLLKAARDFLIVNDPASEHLRYVDGCINLDLSAVDIERMQADYSLLARRYATAIVDRKKRCQT